MTENGYQKPEKETFVSDAVFKRSINLHLVDNLLMLSVFMVSLYQKGWNEQTHIHAHTHSSDAIFLSQQVAVGDRNPED